MHLVMSKLNSSRYSFSPFLELRRKWSNWFAELVKLNRIVIESEEIFNDMKRRQYGPTYSRTHQVKFVEDSL